MGDLLENISRFPKFFAVIILGIFANLFKPVAPLLQRPVTAIALVGFVIAGFTALGLTLRAMLGLNGV